MVECKTPVVPHPRVNERRFKSAASCTASISVWHRANNSHTKFTYKYTYTCQNAHVLVSLSKHARRRRKYQHEKRTWYMLLYTTCSRCMFYAARACACFGGRVYSHKPRGLGGERIEQNNVGGLALKFCVPAEMWIYHYFMFILCSHIADMEMMAFCYQRFAIFN